jgi:hypothetical protein
MKIRSSSLKKAYSSFQILVIAGALTATASLSLADEIIMRDGTVYNGNIVSKTRRAIEIDTKVHGISTRLTLDRRKVKSVHESDDAAPILATPSSTPSTTTKPTLTLPSATEPAEDTDQVIKRDGYNLILEVPMKGTFGKDIYPLAIADSLEWAVEHEVTDVVFRINSGGGEVWAAMDMVDIMKEYRGKVKMHMLIESSISASIWPSFTCDTITMVPGSDFGGAVVYSRTSTGSTEVDLKMNGIMAAKLETTADANGHEGFLVKAMMLSKSSIYAYQENGEWKFSDTTDGIPSNYETIDGPDSVLTLTAKQAVKYGLVTAMRKGKTIEEFAEVHGIDKWDNAGNIGYEIVERDVDKSKKLRSRLTATLTGFLVESSIASNRQSIQGLGSSLQTMRKHLGQYKRLLKQAEDMHMPSIIDSFDDAIDIQFWETEIDTRMKELKRILRGP